MENLGTTSVNTSEVTVRGHLPKGFCDADFVRFLLFSTLIYLSSHLFPAAMAEPPFHSSENSL
jgi:hypothetical protein